jgi:hypothetical protein
MNDLKPLALWELSHVGLGPQPMHDDIICSSAVNQEFLQLPKFGANRYGISGMMMVDPSSHPQQINGLKHLAQV